MGEESRFNFRELGSQFLGTFKDSAIQGLKSQRKDLAILATEFLAQVRHLLWAVALGLIGVTLLFASFAVGLADLLHRPYWEMLLYVGLVLTFMAIGIFRISVSRLKEEKEKLQNPVPEDRRITRDILETDGMGIVPLPA